MNISEELLSGRSCAKTVSPVFTDPRELSDQRKTKEDSLVDLNQQRVQKKGNTISVHRAIYCEKTNCYNFYYAICVAMTFKIKGSDTLPSWNHIYSFLIFTATALIR